MQKAMKKTTSIYLLLPLIASLLFLSCKIDKDDEPSSTYTYSTSLSSALVTNFSLKADTSVMTSLDSVFFTIDADRGLIYNADSLPVGTRIDSLLVTMSFSSGVGTAVFKVLDAKNNTTDVEYTTASSEAIDFRYGVKPVVTSYDGYDEISLTSGFKFSTNVFEKVYTPKDLGLDYVKPADIYGGNTASEAMRVFDSVLEGTCTEAQKNVVLANSACAISVMDYNKSIDESIAESRESLDSGRALAAFKKFVEINS